MNLALTKIHLNPMIHDMNTPAVTILMVEDSAADVLLMRRAFKEAKVDVDIVTASTGEEAISLIDTRFAEGGEHLDLVLLDINMPGIDGLETLKLMREKPQMAYVPIVMLTESRSADHARTAFDYGATDFVNKVARIAEMNALIRHIASEWLPGGMPQPELAVSVA